MISVNRVTLMGRLGTDPELKYTAKGDAMLSFNMATSSREYKPGEKPVYHTEWHRVVIWGKRAEGLFKFLRKGMQAWVEGPMRTSKYEKDGVVRYNTSVLGHVIQVQGDGSPDPPSEIPF